MHEHAKEIPAESLDEAQAGWSEKECQAFGRECARLAGLTANTQVRVLLLNNARDWMDRAAHEQLAQALNH